jgi:amino acid adenylation domain-containing protein
MPTHSTDPPEARSLDIGSWVSARSQAAAKNRDGSIAASELLDSLPVSSRLYGSWSPGGAISDLVMSANIETVGLQENVQAPSTLTLEQANDLAPSPLPVVRRFQALAERQPSALAASFQRQCLTYAELDERSNRLAHYLTARGVGPGVPVAVCVRPSLECLIAMLGVWKARGIYLPLDSTHPEALIGRMLDEAQPRVVLTTAALSGLTQRFPQLCFDRDREVLDEQPVSALGADAELNDAAYLFYTSGTTGKPKGVLATQANLTQYIQSAAQKYGFRSSDVFASLARYTFSISLFELVSPWCCGGSVRLFERDEVLTPERLRIALEAVTVLHAGPSLLGSLFRYLRGNPELPSAFPAMRHASSGGDLVPPSVMQEMKQVFPNAELYVIYGCTEVSCMGTTFAIPMQPKVDKTYVGKPFPNVAVRVLGEGRKPVPLGEVGEICFSGRGVVREYLGLPELTSEKFVVIDGERFYQTGDLGRVHPDGNLEILGRSDFQVQLRGIRIELGGIESTVVELRLAAECALVAKTLADGEQHLVAFLVKPTVETSTEFRRALAAQLPDYMLPQHVVVLDAMPLTVNGKLDRRELRELPWTRQLRIDARVTPGNARERKIAEIFQELLGHPEVGMEDSFFDLGGDSLAAVVALEKISRALGVVVPPHALFENGSVRALALFDPNENGHRPSAIPLNGAGSNPPLFMLAGVHVYRELAKRLEGHYSACAVFAEREFGAFDEQISSHSVEELATDYLEIIRSHQPRGPYRLLGYSFAGILAFEVAQQLRLAGEEVRFLGLVDAALPEWALGWKFRRAQLGRVVAAPPRELLDFVLRRLQRKEASHRAAFARYQDDTQLGPLEERRDLVNNTAATQYLSRLQPFSGKATVIASGDRLRKDPLKSRSCGWGPYISGLSVHRVEADHYRMMSHDPYVSEVAEILKLRLAESDRDIHLRVG